MSTLLLILCVCAAAVWLAKILIRPRQTGPSRDAVNDFSRAMNSIAPERRQRQTPSPRTRPPAGRQFSRR